MEIWISVSSIAISFIALLLGIYNWRKSLVKLRADIFIHPLNGECWAIEIMLSNDSSRPVSILNSKVVVAKTELNQVECRPTRAGFHVYMFNGANVGQTNNPTTFPFQIAAYGARNMEMVLSQQPDVAQCKIHIQTPGKLFKFKVNAIKEG